MRIFVAYRRKDSSIETGRIVQTLRRRFGRKAVFHDVGDIQGGERFRDVIAAQLENAAVVLVVIGHDWLELDDTGQKRIDDPDDHHRFEIESSLGKAACTVIPVLLGDAELPARKELPRQIAGLTELNAVRVRSDPDFEGDMARLEELLAAKVPQERIRLARNRIIAWSSALALVLLLGCLIWWMFRPLPVRVASKGWPGYAPLWIADKMNLCDGVDIEFVDVVDVDDAIKHLNHTGTKRADLGYWLTDSHVIARLQGVPAVVVLKTDISLEADAMIAFSDGANAIRVDQAGHGRHEDLTGKSIAFQRFDPSHAFLLALTRGTDASGESRSIECHWVETTVENAKQRFIDLEVDAAISYEPYLSMAAAALKLKGKNTHRPFTGKDLRDMGHPITDLLVVREDYLAAHPDRVKSIIKGILRAVELLQRGDRVAISHFCEFMDRYAPKENNQKYSESDFHDLVDEDQMVLADIDANRRFFFGKAGQDHSDFRQQLAAAEKQWRSWNESILGGEPFDVGSASGAGDGSWILRDVLDELDATVSGR